MWPGEKGFVGGTNDAATGLTHLGARQYDPSTGRFISPDPILDFTDPQQLNAYTYGRNNPWSFADPSGLWWSWSQIGHAALDVVGLVPVVGEVADVANGVWYLAEKDYLNAGLSFASAIPLAGYGATAVKGAKYVDKAIDAADTVGDGVKAANKASDAGKVADNVTPPAAPKPNPAPKPAPPAKPKDPPKGAKDTSPGKPDGQKPAGGSKADDAVDPKDVGEVGASLRDINPNKGNLNCVRCSIATDQMLAGKPFTAPPAGGPYPTAEITAYSGRPLHRRSIEEIKKSLEKFGDGSRGIVIGERGPDEIGHAFNVVNQRGTIRFLDGQSGTAANLNDGFQSFLITFTFKAKP